MFIFIYLFPYFGGDQAALVPATVVVGLGVHVVTVHFGREFWQGFVCFDVYVYLCLHWCLFSVLPLVVSALVLTWCLSCSSFPTTDPSCSSFPTTTYLLCVSSMRTGSKHLHSLVNGGALRLLPVATERSGSKGRFQEGQRLPSHPWRDLPWMWRFACYIYL